MGLNCKPKQRAWICVPKRPELLHLGLDQLNGHVVQTEHILPLDSPAGPIWKVDPPQACVQQINIQTPLGKLSIDRPVRLLGVPDAWLRPFDDLPPEDVDQQAVAMPAGA